MMSRGKIAPFTENKNRPNQITEQLLVASFTIKLPNLTVCLLRKDHKCRKTSLSPLTIVIETSERDTASKSLFLTLKEITIFTTYMHLHKDHV